MRIAFDLRRIQNPGIGRYMKCLVEGIIRQARDHEYILVMPPGAEHLVQGGNGNVTRLPVRMRYYSIREQFDMPSILRRQSADLFHSPHFVMPLVRPCCCVVTIHDVIYIACREDMPSTLGKLYYKGMMKAAVSLSDWIITDSEFSKSEIIHYLNVDPRRISVIYPGADHLLGRVDDGACISRVLMKYEISSPFLLYTGIYKPRKNHVTLLKAFSIALQRNFVNVKLVIAGPLAEGEKELRRYCAELRISDHVVFTGFVPDDDLRVLYSAATAYVCPSTYEGFGFTVLEAMSCGTPVLCSRDASLPEVAGDAALYFDARSAEELAEALLSIQDDSNLRSQLVASGYENAKRFTWDRSARETLNSYELGLSQSQ